MARRGSASSARPRSLGLRSSRCPGPLPGPGVYEIEHGASLASLIDAAGGPPQASRGPLLAATPERGSARRAARRRGADRRTPGRARRALGAGVVLLLSERACPVAETARVAALDGRPERCASAVPAARPRRPCRHARAAGLQWCEAGVSAANRASRRRSPRRRGACGHPDGAATCSSARWRRSRRSFAEHARHGACEAARARGAGPARCVTSAIESQDAGEPHAAGRMSQSRARQPDRLRGARNVCRAAARASRARRVGLSDRRWDGPLHGWELSSTPGVPPGPVPRSRCWSNANRTRART